VAVLGVQMQVVEAFGTQGFQSLQEQGFASSGGSGDQQQTLASEQAAIQFIERFLVALRQHKQSGV